MNGLHKRSVSLSGHRTSIALEWEFWFILEQMAQHKKESLAGFITQLDRQRSAQQSLASVLRITALRYVAMSEERMFFPQSRSDPSENMVEL
ncbi:ribbon-helix-helix domain-containing protein [Saccharibacter floricola]|uniref:Ribbon-helix-helix domain-containing protein n=1 Tax=Saccharibacter floricola DSM 15669 TaxID=1123227 RepID=A0ABQ0P132_9PROT|nr:ribbon-helix-helix domain-containing protein [Saccharibacter floricola]GBQ08279.1 hypothetical protein AA15669_1715 [Saccharibacter floricola DSM 15669]